MFVETIIPLVVRLCNPLFFVLALALAAPLKSWGLAVLVDKPNNMMKLKLPIYLPLVALVGACSLLLNHAVLSQLVPTLALSDLLNPSWVDYLLAAVIALVIWGLASAGIEMNIIGFIVGPVVFGAIFVQLLVNVSRLWSVVSGAVVL